MMRLKATLAAASAMWLCLCIPARGQVSQVAVEPQHTFNVQLAPLGASNDVNSPQLFGGISPAVTPAGVIRADIGFDYIQPLFSNRSVSQVIPGATGPIAAGVHNFSNDFTFLPRLALQYDFADLGFGVAASAKLLEVTGKLHRDLSLSPGGTSSVDANGIVDVAAANVIEGTKLIDLGETRCFGDTCLQDTLVSFTAGGRYAYVHQNYTSTLVSGDNHNQLSANQEFTGFGVTASVNTLTGLWGNFVFYTSTRGSFLIGTNDRTSTVSLVLPAGQSTSVNATENRTLVVPSLEWEAGIGYGLDLAQVHTGAPPASAALVWFKTGFVGQLWGNVGLLKISEPGGNQFSDGLLLLLGFTVQIGVQY